MFLRLLIALSIITALWGLGRGLRRRNILGQVARRRAVAPAGTTLILIAVLSRHCRQCPTQKLVIAQFAARHSPDSIRISILDAEDDPERVRALRIMTVPTTLIVAADGTAVHVNAGLVGLSTLEMQVSELLLKR